MPIHNDVERENEELRRRVAELEAKKDGGLIRFKVTQKGGVSVYGLGRFPVTLSRSMEETPRRDARPRKIHRRTPARAFHQGLTFYRESSGSAGVAVVVTGCIASNARCTGQPLRNA
jgi:hypothetical protein